VVAIDLDGKISPTYNLAWDTTTKKSPAEIRKQLATMVTIGENNLVTAGKDISNPGMVGTLGMLLETSGVGAVIELAQIPRPNTKEVSFAQWLKMYPGAGYVLTVGSKAEGAECIRIFQAAGITASIIGEVDTSKKLRITNGEETVTVFDFKTDKITGIAPGIMTYTMP
jgi:hypothetical protein